MPATGTVAQVLEQAVGRAPHMQDHRQAMPVRQQQLLAVEELLAIAVQPRHEMVEPDLAHRHQPRVVAQRGQLPVELGQVLLAWLVA